MGKRDINNMANYTEEEMQAKRQALRNKSVLSYANTINTVDLYLLDHRLITNRINHCMSELRFNNTGFYRSSSPYKCTTFLTRKQLEDELRELDGERRRIEKTLDDLAEEL